MPKVLGAVKFIFGISPKALTGAAGICYIRLAMEVGLFFMPKKGQPRKLPGNTSIKKYKARWKLCVQESHWNVQNASSVTTT